ncbi:hypothetical protein L2E82_08344 [Cichorium intybus]|uniref:Uncharacterized protein n=1 Tax=Cichorium intybus TaxID=13427 RepID=A0ACB9G6A5_CICIN|nr:hypothetical protein L2E82_08344 [Cichorium intybus]
MSSFFFVFSILGTAKKTPTIAYLGMKPTKASKSDLAFSGRWGKEKTGIPERSAIHNHWVGEIDGNHGKPTQSLCNRAMGAAIGGEDGDKWTTQVVMSGELYPMKSHRFCFPPNPTYVSPLPTYPFPFSRHQCACGLWVTDTCPATSARLSVSLDVFVADAYATSIFY